MFFLAFDSDDTTVRIWSLDSDKPETTFSGDQAHISSVNCGESFALFAYESSFMHTLIWWLSHCSPGEWHPYRSLIATGGRDSFVKLWDPRQKEKPVCTITTHKTQINCLSWSANGNSLATAAKDSYLRIFDLRNLNDCTLMQGHDNEITALDWHPQHERVILTGANNGSLIYWIVGESQVRCIR